MCGLLGIIAQRGRRPSVDGATARVMRDVMERRGPDGHGYWEHENAILAHRRLAIRDVSEAGAQPMATPDGRFQIVYNGELYNDQELRKELLDLGAVPGGFKSSCDTETILWAFATWGQETWTRLRGMFSIGVYDTVTHRLSLARDPMGIKPLYYHLGVGEVIFASEVNAILAHPGVEPVPDMAMASAYLSTVRSVMGHRTMFENVHAIRPGEAMVFEASTGDLSLYPFHMGTPAQAAEDPELLEHTRAMVADSTARHMHADVKLGAFLSGGLDSTVLCREASLRSKDLHTWCSGLERGDGGSDDASHALEAADFLGLEHSQNNMGRERFSAQWKSMVHDLGIPLSTPNEIAIHDLCLGVRDSGTKVILSGEGADEIFGGYEMTLQAAWDFEQNAAETRQGGIYQLESSAWVAPHLKPRLITGRSWQESGHDEWLHQHYHDTFEDCVREAGSEATALDAHLRFLRHQNLPGLLQRLDTSSMLASVEGRTPFADVEMASFAEALPMLSKFQPSAHDGSSTLAVAVTGKLALRRAYKGMIPASIETRAKHSFPLPFESWMSDCAETLTRSAFAREFFAADLRAEVARDPETHWRFAWPMINLSLWGERWWG
ncbi:MAG: asparagine synthase (glutamine-hydrolyzing) [Planctomycetota bacterium]|nr:asparagine synthase (glutamine-hydrolyzing) [Planctomycetota bacterium]